MRYVDLQVVCKISNIVDCLHTGVLKTIPIINTASSSVKYSQLEHLNRPKYGDGEIEDGWVYCSEQFPLMLNSISTYESVSVKHNAMIDSKMIIYPSIPNHLKRSRDISQYIVMVRGGKADRCIKTSNIKSTLDIANVVTYHYTKLNLGDIDDISDKNISVYLCRREQ